MMSSFCPSNTFYKFHQTFLRNKTVWVLQDVNEYGYQFYTNQAKGVEAWQKNGK